MRITSGDACADDDAAYNHGGADVASESKQRMQRFFGRKTARDLTLIKRTRTSACVQFNMAA